MQYTVGRRRTRNMKNENEKLFSSVRLVMGQRAINENIKIVSFFFFFLVSVVANLDEIISLLIPFGISRWKTRKIESRKEIKCSVNGAPTSPTRSFYYLKLEMWEWERCTRGTTSRIDAVKAIRISFSFDGERPQKCVRYSLGAGSRCAGERTEKIQLEFMAQ